MPDHPTLPDEARPRTRRFGGVPPAETLFAAAWGAAAMLYIQLGWTGLSGNDSYYHAKMALMLPEWGFVQTFPWLRWTIFNDRFVSHHHGFHVLLAPFVWLAERLFADPQAGAKCFVALAAGATTALYNHLLRRLDTPHRLLWTLLIGCVPWHFWLRLSYVRAPVVALPLMLLAVNASLRSHWIALAVLGFVFTHVYGGAVLLPLIPAAFAAADWFCRGPSLAGLRPLAATLLGVALGLVVNPYFPANVGFLWTQLFQTGLGAPAEAGTEWKPFDAWFLARIALPLGVVWAAALFVRLRSRAAPSSPASLALLALNLGFFLLTLKSRRFVEYWPVFALLNAADWWAAAARASAAPAEMSPTIDTSAAGGPPSSSDAVESRRNLPRREAARMRRAAGALVLAAVLLGNALTLRAARDTAIEKGNLTALARAMDYLRSSTPAGALVLTDDWDVFPECFYFNHHNHYAVGLDPVFTQVKFPELWERYRVITRGQAPATLSRDPTRNTDPNPGPLRVTLDDVARCFEADYVLVAADHAALYRQLTVDARRFERVFPPPDPRSTAQPPYAVFRVRPAEQPSRSQSAPARL